MKIIGTDHKVTKLTFIALMGLLAIGTIWKVRPVYATMPPSPVKTDFRPETDSFKFVNDFVYDVVLDVRMSGLCGGMSYSALDYYYTKTPFPVQPFSPAANTTLHKYLYERQFTAVTSNLDKWAEIGFNPGGARDSEFFNWGISAKKGERIDELKSFIDNGKPAVLGLQGDGKTGNHQVIAYGYDMGRYKGDLGAFKEDFKIFILDPNHPGETRTLVPDVKRQIYHELEGGDQTWRTYFVDKNYHVKQPPEIKKGNFPDDGMVHELVLRFSSGGDDLRGGNDNVNLVINLMDGTQQVHKNINLGARWVGNGHENAEVALEHPIKVDQITSLIVSTTFTGGLSGDNWDMNSLNVHTWGAGFYNSIKSVGEKRFTGENKVLIVPINDVVADKGQINSLRFSIKTGGDDLRGVNDNLNVSIRFRDGQVQRLANANGGKPWANNTSHSFEVDLNRAVKPSQIEAIDLQTTFTGGTGGDNWNMDSISVRATGNDVDEVIATHGFKRFTGDDKFLSIPVTFAAAGKANKLEFAIRTGDDDLRGGNDNLNVILRFRDGRSQVVRNVNGGARWADNSTHAVTVNLDRAMDPSDIVEIDLQTTFSGGMGGDNWNMDSASVKALGAGVTQVIFKHGAKRFTGDDKTLRLTKA